MATRTTTKAKQPVPVDPPRPPLRDLKRILATDVTRETEGVLTDLGVDWDCRFRIAGVGSPRYRYERQRIYRGARLRQPELFAPDLPAERSAARDVMLFEIETLLYGRAVLLDFEHVDWNGETLEATEANRVMLLREVPRLFPMVENFFRQFPAYRPDQDEVGLGNFERSSPGDSGVDRKTSDGSNNSAPNAAVA